MMKYFTILFRIAVLLLFCGFLFISHSHESHAASLHQCSNNIQISLTETS